MGEMEGEQVAEEQVGDGFIGPGPDALELPHLVGADLGLDGGCQLAEDG